MRRSSQGCFLFAGTATLPDCILPCHSFRQPALCFSLRPKQALSTCSPKDSSTIPTLVFVSDQVKIMTQKVSFLEFDS
jgi:hypothetical protein